MSEPRNLVIVGTGGLAKEMAQLARQVDPTCSRWNEIAYCADSAEKMNIKLPFGKVTMTDEELILSETEVDVVVGVGYPWVRKSLLRKLRQISRLHFPNVIHPSVVFDPELISMGVGNVITAGCVLTCDIVIGDFNLFNWNSTVGHDVEIGSFNVVNPSSSISGHVKIGNACLIGAGARIIENLDVADDVIIGAGAVVARSVESPGVYIGVPAKYIKPRAP